MKMNVEFESREELLSFVGMFGNGSITSTVDVEKCGQVAAKNEKPKEEVKAPVEKPKKDKVEDKKVEQSKTENPKEEKTEEPPKVDSEVVGVNQENGEVVDVNEAPKITKEDIRTICGTAMKAGKQAEVKSIVSKYGAKKVPDIKEEDYEAVYKEVKELL